MIHLKPAQPLALVALEPKVSRLLLVLNENTGAAESNPKGQERNTDTDIDAHRHEATWLCTFPAELAMVTMWPWFFSSMPGTHTHTCRRIQVVKTPYHLCVRTPLCVCVLCLFLSRFLAPLFHTHTHTHSLSVPLSTSTRAHACMHVPGRKAFVVQKWEMVLTSMVFTMRWSSASRNGLPVTMPALFTSIVTAPTCKHKQQSGHAKHSECVHVYA